MAKTVPYENIGYARTFIDKFGLGEVSIDDFDMFIIDQGLADDPGTSDTKANAYKGFIQQRTAARRLLNTAGGWLNGSSFQVVMPEPKTDLYGKAYLIKPWNEDAKSFGANLGNSVKKYTQNRVNALQALHKKALALSEHHDDDAEFRETAQMLAFVGQHSIELRARIAGLVTQYNVAVEAVEDKVKALSAHYDTVPALAAPTEE
jgi:hypothetical protein